MRDPKERLQDILEAIGHIERYAAYGRSLRKANSFKVGLSGIYKLLVRLHAPCPQS
jgi:hypothetical protein